MPARFKQKLAKPEALIRGREIEFVNLSLALAARAGRPPSRVPSNRAACFENEQSLAGGYRVAPPAGPALADHGFEMKVRNDSAIGVPPGLAENVRERLGVAGFRLAHDGV